MSILKNTFGQYFPSLHSLPDKESKAQVTLKIGSKDHSAQIDSKIFITIDKLPEKFWKKRKSPGQAIPFDEFMYLFDGTPFDETYDLFRYLCKGKGVYTLKDVDGWVKELFSDRGKAVLAKLKAEKGLSETTIKKYKIGYDPENELIIFPYLNYTNKGVSAINFYSAKNLKYVKNYGGDRLFGYHDIIKGQYKLGYIFVAIDEFEAILLRQLGYNAISPFCVWRHYFEEHLGPFYVLIYNDGLIETVDWRFDTIDNTCNGVYSIKFGDNTICDLVLNKGYDKQKLDELIQKKEPLNGQRYANLVGYRDFRSKNELKFIEFSQFLYNGIQYYGVPGGKELHLISGERADENIQLFLANNPNIKFEDKSDFKSSFSSEGYKRYLLEGYTPSEKSVFTKIVEYLKDFIYLPDEILYKFIALWVMGTYFYLNFKYYPYIHLQAPKASGKSTLLDVLHHICFNASYDLGPTAPVIFRQINTFQATILLDEVESFKTNSGQREILQILNQGYSSEGRIYRAKGEGVSQYKVYSPKIFAGINKINDVLLSRSIKVPIEKKPTGVKLKRFRVDSKLEKRIQRINDDLYIFGLLYAPEVNKIDKIIHELPETEDLENRELDTWGPIFSIAKVVDKNGKLGLIKDLQEYVELDRRLKTENFEEDESKLHALLKEYLTEENMLKKNKKKEMIFSRDDLFDAAKSESVLPKGIDSVNKLTSYLKKVYKIRSENVDVDGNKNKKYVVTKALLDQHFPSDTKTAPKQPKTSPTSAKAKVVTKTKTSLYVPENVIITEGAKKYKTTDETLDRIKKLNPKVNVSYSKDEIPTYKGITTQPARYHHMKKTVVLAERQSAFFETFPSPGRIIEKPNTMIKSVYNCCYECEFCYLQTRTVHQYWQKVFVNYERLENEIKNEYFIDTMVRSMLTIVSKLGGTELNKIPGKFNTVMNGARDTLSRMGTRQTTEGDVLNHFKTYLTTMLGEMEYEYEIKKLKPVLKKLDKIFEENKKFTPVFVISEYCDLLGIDHISDQLKFYMDLINKDDKLKLSFRTRSANFNRLLKYSGKNRVAITLQIDPQYVIDNYQTGTSSLSERIDAAKNILKAKGFQLKLSIEPIIMYKGYEKDYIDLINTLAKNLDLNLVESVEFGGLRADKKLQSNINQNYPNTDLLKLEYELVKPTGETKWRYPLDERVRIYKLLKAETEKHTKTRISLAAENPEAWEQTGLKIIKADDYFYKLK